MELGIGVVIIILFLGYIAEKLQEISHRDDWDDCDD